MEAHVHTHLEDIASKYEYFLFDCDGVIWEGEHEIEGAIKALEYLQSLKKKLFFLSNNSTKSREDFVAELAKHHFTTSVNTIICSAYVLASLFASNYPNFKSVYVVGEKGIVTELQAIGITCFGHQLDSKIEFTKLGDPKKIVFPHMDAVVVGLDREYNYYKLFMAANHITKGAKFFATNTDSFIKMGDNKLPGAGSMVTSIQAPTNIRPIVIGKPSAYSLDAILRQEGLTKSDLGKFIMIGDRLDTDMKFAENCQIDSCLVLSGVTTGAEYSELQNKDGITLPTYVMNRLGQFKGSNDKK